ncbi:S8 family peptidase [Cupriavidus sp. SW-Y-13]|uniref:S8 family peptidase n=1 Tax=Cupriavidus sp. SW-Y-13 TaxID=2653854 RepID=UPI0013660FEA|nr:S8 family peptidase [Cupriavidus sp. SW-Y-13]MWL87158.1 S8 family serine peptidase [Cupriavidus sp. SW-Y-13]
MPNKNLLLGGGEKLAGSAKIVRGGGPKKRPYTLDEVRAELLEPVNDIATALRNVSVGAKPRGEAVFEMTLHPSFLARSYYPAKLLNATGLRDVGSKERTIVPRKASEDRLEGKPHATASILVAGKEDGINRLASFLSSVSVPDYIGQQLTEIESVKWLNSEDKVRGELPVDDASHSFEVALHAGPNEDDIVIGFQRFAMQLGADVDLKRRIRVGGLTFVPVNATSSQLLALSEFTFLRVARPMPALRIAVPNMVRQTMNGIPFALPTGGPIHTSERVAIFDGGLGTADLSAWATEYTFPETSDTSGALLMHGSEVTSTFLFGRPKAGAQINRPFMGVDHYRVLAPTSGKDPDLFDVLLRIKGVLEAGRHRFANLSLGPRMPVYDDEVHVWTATLDQLCANYDILLTVAVGNDGEAKGADRIQPPGDMVNAIAVGASNSAGPKWKRAPYSCIGPGRSPGYVKPDGVAFGGSAGELFEVFNPLLGSVVGVSGTSYSSPLTLRTAAGVAATTNYDLSSIALKALLIHHSEHSARLPRAEVGWGRFREDALTLLECGPDSATVIFRAALAKGEFRRCPVPFPDVLISGKVTVRATFCICAHTDPEHAINYTRSGMGVTFRPLLGLGDETSTEFFGIKSQYKAAEREMRDAGHKWETVLHRSRDFTDGTSLSSPVFDVEYHAREVSRSVPPASAPDVSFALVVTVHAPGVTNLYDLIRQKYPVLQPVELRSDVVIDT